MERRLCVTCVAAWLLDSCTLSTAGAMPSAAVHLLLISCHIPGSGHGMLGFVSVSTLHPQRTQGTCATDAWSCVELQCRRCF